MLSVIRQLRVHRICCIDYSKGNSIIAFNIHIFTKINSRIPYLKMSTYLLFHFCNSSIYVMYEKLVNVLLNLLFARQ